MVNILGQHVVPLTNSISEISRLVYSLIWKSEAKTNRKMGHVTILSTNIEETLKEIEQSGIWSRIQRRINK